MYKERANIRKTLNFLIRGVIILVTYGFIYRQVFHLQKPAEVLGTLETALEQQDKIILLSLIVLLMLMNWGVESLKWKLLIAKIEAIGFLKSYKAVLTGVSVSLFTPNRTGDYLGRVFILDRANHIEGILVTLIGSFAQLVVTLCVGLFCLLSFLDHYFIPRQHEYLVTGLIFLVPAAVFIVLLVYFKIGLFSDFVSRYFPARWKKLSDYASVFSRYSARELFWNLMLSLLRYIVFTTQFLLLLRLFGAAVPAVEGFILIAVIYLFMTLVPTVALVDLGIRGSVSLYILGMYFKQYAPGYPDPEIAILAASTALWMINLILPAILGTFFVFNLKFFRK
jgi:hypothetical protein